MLDTRAGAAERMVHVRGSPRILEEYEAFGMGEIDPQVPYAASMPGSGYFLDTDHVDLGDPKTAEFTGWMASFGLKHHMTMVA